MLEVPRPGDGTIDPQDYDFEKSVTKPDGSPGSADVWKKGCFAWEYKGPGKSLIGAYSQLKDYVDALDNPPLLIVSDMQEIQIHTNFTNEIKETHRFTLGDLTSVEARRLLSRAFTDPEKLRPEKTPEAVTEEAAASIGVLATRLRAHDYEPRRVAHFLNKLVFCMFAEDIDLLPHQIFTEVLERSTAQPDLFDPMVRQLFAAMRDKNGLFGTTAIPWFNGGLFDDDDVLPLGPLEIKDLLAASHLDWSVIEPSIFGTLFERGLDPAKRKEMASLFDAKSDDLAISASKDLFAGHADKAVGVHYTDAEKIMKIIEPVVLRPLRLEWEEVKATVAKHRAKKEKAKSGSAKTKAENAARDAYLKFRRRLGDYRVLDPACGSGNFLYMALRELKDFDLQVRKEADDLELPADEERVTPEAVLGIEINPYAAELAQVTIWIGEIQWQIEKGFRITRSPILGKLASIKPSDALIQSDGTEMQWPKADAIVGNPPFLGGKLLITNLGEDYVSRIFSTYKNRVPAEADLVCYWFVKACEAVRSNQTRSVGLVATNSIRGGANRRALNEATDRLAIFDAWGDEPWVVNGAAVRVSLVAIASSADRTANNPSLDGKPVTKIFTDLTARHGDTGVDITQAQRLKSNANAAFMGDTKGGAFNIPGALARKWLGLPKNPNGRPNSDVLKPWINGMDVTRRPADKWIIDFGWELAEEQATLYEAPFEYIREHVYPKRSTNRREHYKKFWWRHMEPRPGMHKQIGTQRYFIATPTVAKHRLFAILGTKILADHQLIVIARDDDTTFGVLHSKFHELWSLRKGTSLEDRPRYTPSTTFETFPFPDGLTPDIPAADYASDERAMRIAEAANTLNELRENWLNPEDLVRREPEVVPGYPDRILPRNEKAAKELKKRTLTNLYNARPAWLDHAHRNLDETVAAAYGWEADLSDDEILKRLLDLNLERAAAQDAKS